jgi:hypothetical protein
MKKLIMCFSAVIMFTLLFPTSILASPNSPGKDIVKYTFIHYQASNKPPKPAPTEGSYSLYKGGVKWADTIIVDYAVNPDGAPQNIQSEIKPVIEAAFEEWDRNTTSRNLFADHALNTDKVGVTYDGENTISWTKISQQGVIAMCSFWVNTRTKQIVEFDIQFNTVYNWNTSLNCSDTEMDVLNIATHEIGHTLVLNDLYRDANSNQTMYGYSDYGDIEKRSLESGDIAGIRALYGN